MYATALSMYTREFLKNDDPMMNRLPRPEQFAGYNDG